jgi:uncharacterized membrane protein YbaN (DUF454 family)
MHHFYNPDMRTWIRIGLVGAILYPIANIAFLFAALCGFESSTSACRLAGWLYMHLFPGEMLEGIFYMRSPVPWFAMVIVADALIGFAIGAIGTVLITSIRRRQA